MKYFTTKLSVILLFILSCNMLTMLPAILLFIFSCICDQPMSMALPGVVGFKLYGTLRNGVTATDLVLTVTQMLRKHGVVGTLVEFYGIKI